MDKLMSQKEYTTKVLSTLSADGKHGLVVLGRKKKSLNLGHAIMGISSETGETVIGLTPFLLGQQLSAVNMINVREELGDLCYFTAVAVKELGIKGVQAAKRYKAPKDATIAGTLLAMVETQNALIDLLKKCFYGRELDFAKAEPLVEKFVPQLFTLIDLLFQCPPAEIYESNIAKLQVRYPAGFFDKAAELDRDYEAEAVAVAA